MEEDTPKVEVLQQQAASQQQAMEIHATIMAALHEMVQTMKAPIEAYREFELRRGSHKAH